MTFLMLTASVVLLTIAGGGLFPATVGIVAVVIGGMACLAVPRAALALSPRSHPQASGRPTPYLELAAALILLFILLTSMPLPPQVEPLFGSVRHQQNQAVVSAFHTAAKIGVPAPDREPWFALTRNRAGTLRFFLLITAAVGAFMLGSTLPPRWKLAYLYFLACLGSVVGIAGWLGQWKIPQGDTLWWFIPVPHAPTSPVGCFLNRNHFAGFVAMLSPVALALAHEALLRRRWFVSTTCLFLTGVMMIVVFLSLSRGALLSMGAGLAATSAVIAFRERKLWGILFLTLMLVGSIVIVWTNAAVRTRLAEARNPANITSVQSRLAEWRESLRVCSHYPVIGAGMNALRMVYPQHRQTSVGARLLYAENEYIQLAAEGGLIGVGLAVAFIIAAIRRLRDTGARPPGVIFVAGSGALTVTAIHCLFDFPAHLPLYALVLGSLTGLLFTTPDWSTPWPRRIAILPAVLGLAGTLLIAVTQPANLKTMDDPAYLHTASYKDLHRALIWAPTSSSAWLFLGRAVYREGSIRNSDELCVRGETFMKRAVELDPKNYRLWYELGEIRLHLKDYSGAREAFSQAQQLRSWLTPPYIPEGNR